jgi:VIT1/CCC1 family predicted Fe2+/Mn2+ transporter
VSPAFFRDYLEPADRLNEVLFGLIMVLTFTLTAGLTVEDGPDASRELLIATLGCNLAWGVIDGAMFLMSALLERSRRVRVLAAVQHATDEATALAAIDRVLDGTVLSIAPPGERARIARTVAEVARRLPAARTRVHRDDVYGAIASGLLVMLATLPAVLPFLVMDDARRALRVSNFLLIGLLFATGHAWGRHAHVGPWRAGFVFLLVGLALVGTAILLGG